MADHASSTPAPDVHHLTGTTPPGAAAPPFEPICGGQPHARPRPHPRREADNLSWLDEVGDASFDRETHPERELMAACGDAHDVLEEEEDAWAAVADKDPDSDDDTVETSRRLSADVRRLSLELSKMRARTPEGLSAKAGFLLEALFPNGKMDTASDHVDLLRSILEDSLFIGTRSRFTIPALVGLEKDPPVSAPEEGWRFRHLIQDWAHETLEDAALDEIYDRVYDTKVPIVPPKGILVREGDRRLFKLPSGGWEVKGFGRVYGGTIQLDAIRDIYVNESPNLSFEINNERRKRASEILDAQAEYQSEIDKQNETLGISRHGRDSHWRVENCKGLRQRILSTPVSTLDGLLLKALVVANCGHTDLASAAAEIEDDLIKANLIEGATDTVIAKAIMLDLVRILIARGITVRGVAGHPERRPASNERVAA